MGARSDLGRSRDKRVKNQFPEAFNFMTKKEIILIFILVAIATARFFFVIPKNNLPQDISGREVSFEGQIIDNPDIRNFNQQLIVSPTNQKINILIIAPKEIDISYGDLLKVNGVIETPQNFLTEVGKEFNYKRYLANKDVYYLIKYPQIEIVSSDHGHKIKTILFNIRNSFVRNIEKVLIPPKSSLANGLLVGARGGIDNDLREKFIETGTIHIVALSGYNLSVIGDNIILIFGLIFTQAISMIIGLVIIILFIIMTGATGTAVRAGIMATILLFARISGRKYEAGRALIITGLLMIAYDPRVVTDLSFELSFLATFGLIFIMPKIIEHLKFLPYVFKIRENVATTLSATIAVLPLLLYSTGVFSVVSLPANILILPFIPFTMFLSFLTGIIGYLSPLLSMLSAYIADLFLSYILFITNFFASLPFASFGFRSFPLILTILIYVVILWWIFKKEK